MREPDPSLEAVCCAIAQHARPDLGDGEIGDLLDACAAGFSGHDSDALCRFLFVDQGFRGNSENYYEDANSFLDRVLERRLGIPLTLSIAAIEVGRRVGVHLVPIGMPGHVLVRDRDDMTAFHDPFAGGVKLDLAGCEARFRELHGAEARFGAHLLEPTSVVALAARMLNNLTNVYLQEPDRASLVWVLRLRTLTPGVDVDVVRQLGGVLSNLGRFWEAADVFEDLARRQPEYAEQHLGSALRLRANSN